MLTRKGILGLGTAATFVAALVGLQSLGWAWPWTALTVPVADERYVSKEKFESEYRAVVKDIHTELQKLNNRLPGDN